MGNRPPELRGGSPAPLHNLKVQTIAAPNHNGVDEMGNGPRGEMAPVSRPPITSPKHDLEPGLMMRQVCTIEEGEAGLPSSPPAGVKFGKVEGCVRILGVLSVVACFGLWFLG